MNKRLCRGLSFLLVVVMLLGCVGCGKKSGGLDTVRVCEVTHSIFYAPQYAAIALGFFEEEGIEIELSNGQGADAVMAAVLSGNIDVGFAGPEAAIYVYNEGKKAFGYYGGQNKWTLLTLKDSSIMAEIMPEFSEASRNLDDSVLHNLILEEVLGIDKENMANQVNLTYTRSAEEAFACVDSGEFQCSFILNPTRVEEIGAVAAAGEKMPQKSTYFYPKIITGLTLNKF